MPIKDLVDLIVDSVAIVTLVAVVIYVWKTWQLATATKDLASTTSKMSIATQKSAEATLKSAEISEKVLKEMEASRDLLIAPHVIIFFDNPYETFGQIFLVVRNVGKGVAYDIKFKFEPGLVNSYGSEIGKIHMLEQGIASLPPEYEIRHFFDHASAYFSDQVNGIDSGLPKMYDVEVTFSGGLSKEKRSLKQRLDLLVYKGTHVVRVRKILEQSRE